MPSIRINPVLSNGVSYYRYYYKDNDYIEPLKGDQFQWGEQRGYGTPTTRDVDASSTQTIFTYQNMRFSFNNELREYIPDNTYFVGVTIHFYVSSGRENEKMTFYLGDSAQQVTMTPGWHSFYFSKDYAGMLMERGVKSFELSYTPVKGEYRITNLMYRTGQEYFGETYSCTSLYGVQCTNPVPQYNYIHTRPKSDALLVSTHSSTTTAPYIELMYAHNPPVAPDSLAPDGITVNPRGDIRFSWNSRINQKRFNLQYRLDGGTWQDITRTTRNRFYDLPANTILAESGEVEWRVRVAEETDVFSEYVEAGFTLGVPDQVPPRAVSPISDYVNNQHPVRFQWNFISNTTEEQEAWEIEYSRDRQKWTTLKGTTENETFLDVSDWDSITAYWRMRVKNQFGKWSAWTDTFAFHVIGAPPIPQIISVSGYNLPLIKWQAKDQEVYRVYIENRRGEQVYDSGRIVDSVTKQHKVTKVLPDGTYTARLMIYNIYDVASPISNHTWIIESPEQPMPELQIFQANYYTRLKSDHKAGEVLRDGEVIGKLKDGVFEDYTGACDRNYRYQVRAITPEGIVTDSKPVSGKTTFWDNSLARLSKPGDFIKLGVALDSPPTKNLDFSVSGTELYLDGRKHPMFEFGEHESTIIDLSFHVKDYMPLLKLVSGKEELLYRDIEGRNLIGVARSVDVKKTVFGYAVSLSILRTGDEL